MKSLVLWARVKLSKVHGQFHKDKRVVAWNRLLPTVPGRVLQQGDPKSGSIGHMAYLHLQCVSTHV